MVGGWVKEQPSPEGGVNSDRPVWPDEPVKQGTSLGQLTSDLIQADYLGASPLRPCAPGKPRGRVLHPIFVIHSVHTS